FGRPPSPQGEGFWGAPAPLHHADKSHFPAALCQNNFIIIHPGKSSKKKPPDHRMEQFYDKAAIV
ncbi:MAG: hypothetical protein ACI4PT_11515, partial [Candidatus Avoscillospira sp.]